MKLVAVISLTIFISSVFCGSLNRIKKRGLLSEDNVKSIIKDDMQNAYQTEISPFNTSTIPRPTFPANNLESYTVDPTDDSALDNDILKDIFETTDKTPSTTSSAPPPSISIKSRIKDTKEEDNDTLLDKDTLDFIFQTSDESPSTTSTTPLASDKDTLDVLAAIFVNIDESPSTTSTTTPTTSLLNNTDLDKDTIDAIFGTNIEPLPTTSTIHPIISRLLPIVNKPMNMAAAGASTDAFGDLDSPRMAPDILLDSNITEKDSGKSIVSEESKPSLQSTTEDLDDIFKEIFSASTNSTTPPTTSLHNNTDLDTSTTSTTTPTTSLLNKTDLDRDTIDAIFGTNNKSPSTTSTTTPTTSLLNNTDLDEDTIDVIFGTNNKSPSTTSTTTPTTSLLNKTDLDRDTIDAIFGTNNKSPSTTSTTTPTTSLLNNTDLDKDTIDIIFGTNNKSPSTTSTTPTTSLLNNTDLDKDTIDAIFGTNNESREIIDTTTENPNAKNITFNYRYVDWIQAADRGFAHVDYTTRHSGELNKSDLGEPHNDAGTRMNEDPGDNDDKESHTSDEGKIILTYNVSELDPPLEPSVPSRIDVNKSTPKESSSTEETTDSYELYDSGESATEAIDTDETPNEIRECNYGTPKFPIPEPKVKKYAGKNRRRIADIKCEEQMLYVKYNIFDAAKNNLTCRSRQGYSSIIGGKKSLQKQFPHMGAVGWIDTDNRPVFFCGSTLISPRFSVTAAHCRSTPERGSMNVISPYPKLVRFGSVDIASNEDVIDLNIDAFLTLPEFDAKPLKKYNDIALIRFTEDIKFSDLVRPACVWHKSMDDLTTGYVTGWGQTVSRDVNSRSTHLRYAEVNILKHDTCAEQINHRKFRHWEGLIDKQFCAGTPHGSGDTCQGDSGGPLQVQEPFEKDGSITVYHLVGITSFGFDCGRPEAPGLYTKVNKYLCFIEEHVWPSTKNRFCP